MPATIFGNPAVAVGLYQAFYGKAPANATYVNNVALATQSGPAALAAAIGANFAATPAADLAKLVLANLSISNATLETALGQIFTAYPAGARGQIVLNLTNLLSNLESDATYGAAAKAYNVTVAANNAYSSNVANTTDSTPNATTGNEAAKSLVLTTAQDVLVGGSGNDNFRAVAGNPIGNQDQTTLNSSDIIDGGAGTDALIVNLLGNYGGGARIKGIETLQLGSNVAGAVAFDYNVNAGFNEISDVRTVVADQINVGETLSVGNIVRTVDGTTSVLPTLSWVNDSNMALAGTVNYLYRAAELTGTADNQIVSLDSVNNGVLNLGAGVETVTLRSVAGERVTLLNSDRTDVANAGLNNVRADIISDGSLTTVNIEAAAEVGKVGGRVAATGLVDNADQLGNAATGTRENLLSVGARVTTVDANTSTANVNVQFLAKTTGAATNVAFTGGAGNDYAEFEIGNVNAKGGAGNDVFAFVTQRAGVTNSTFGSGDSIEGGAGTDTVQIGVNGVGSYDVASSEFLNKTGVDVLDLRGAVNTVSVSAAFAGQTDGAALNITTDNVVVGGTAPSDAEAATVNTINLRDLNAGQAIKFTGGQGSDRIILKDNVYTQAMDLDGGLQTNAAGVAAAGDYDTLTVVNSAVLDRTDLSNTRNFEGLNLVKDVVGAAQFTVELTEAFLLANTAATNSLTTSIDDRVFQIGSVVSPFAGAVALAAGDVVRIDVTDLFNTATNTIKASVAGRQIDTTGLGAANVQYVYNGNTLTLAQLQAAVTGAAVVTGNDAGRAGVIGAGAPGVTPATPVALTAGGTFAGTAGVNDNFTGTYASLNGTTITGTAADTETLTMTGAVAAAIGGGGAAGTITNIDVLQLADVANTVTFGGTTGITQVNGGSAADDVNLAGLTLAASAALGAGNDTLRIDNKIFTGTFAGGDNNDTLRADSTGGTVDLTSATVNGFENLVLVNGTAGTDLTVGANANLGQFASIRDDGTNAAFTINVAAGSHDISSSGINFNAATADVINVTAGTLTINGDAQFTAAAWNFTGAGNLTTLGSLTLAAADSISGTITLGAAGLTLTDRAAATTVVGSAGADTIDMQATVATGAKTINLGGAGADVLSIAADTTTALHTISGWTTAAVIDLDTTAVTATMVTAAAATVLEAGAGSASNLYILDTAASQITGALSETANGGAVEQAIIRAALTSTAGVNNTEFYLALDNGTDSGVYRVAITQGGVAGALDTFGEIAVTHVATIVGVQTSALAANDFS